MQRFLAELRRRHVFRVAALYAIIAWLIVQVAANTFPHLQLPDWAITGVIVLAALGFPLALILAYAYELTPDGVQRADRGVAADAAPGAPPPAAAAAGPAHPPAAVADPSVAVLPFVNLSAEPENEYFSDGITEEILDALTKLEHLRVAARTSSFAFKGLNADVSEVAARLRVGSVLEGSVRRVGDRVRITAQLVDGATGFHRWSRTFDRQLSDIFTVQAEIAREIADAFELSLTERERRQMRGAPTADLSAYDYYLRGRFYFHRLRRVDLEHAATMFRRATELDPGFARAYAGLVDSLTFLYLWFDHREALLEEAEAASRKALELQPELAEAHAAYGHVLSLKRLYDEAEAEFERAIALDPNLFEAHYLYGRSSQARGDADAAARHFGEAHRLRPDDYQSLALQVQATTSEPEARRLRAEALRVVDRHLALHPDDVRAVYFRALLLGESGEFEEARRAGERALRMEPYDPGVVYNVACLEARLGNAEQALALLERTVELGFIHRDWLEHDPDFDAIRSSPRFEAVLRRLE